MKIFSVNMTKKILPLATATAIGAGALISTSTPASAKPGWYYKAQREYAEKERQKYMGKEPRVYTSDDNDAVVISTTTTTTTNTDASQIGNEAALLIWPRPKSNMNYKISAEQIKDAKKIGEAMQDCLHGYTTQGDWNEFNGYIKKVTPQNVMYVLAGYMDETRGLIFDSDGFFEQLYSEWGNRRFIGHSAEVMIKNVQTYVNDNMDKLNEVEQQSVIKMLYELDDYKYNNGWVIDDIVNTLLNCFNINNK